MPPEVSQKSLSDEQIDLLKRWIEQGADWDQHWSFKPIDQPAPTAVEDEAWVREPLDRFVLARLEDAGLSPAEEADRRSLARRVALDLTGLPPDPGTLATFLARHGRAAPTSGSSTACSRHPTGASTAPATGSTPPATATPTASTTTTTGRCTPTGTGSSRRSTENQPFDEFTVDQIAGDLLEDPTLDQLIATGLQRNNITTNEGGVVIEEYEAIYAKDRAETIGSVFLGLTVGCATCHDHKFDPISTAEFYALTAFFRNTTQYVITAVPQTGRKDGSEPCLVV